MKLFKNKNDLKNRYNHVSEKINRKDIPKVNIAEYSMNDYFNDSKLGQDYPKIYNIQTYETF